MVLTISIVSYNTKDLLKRCLLSIKKHLKKIRYEIIVVDNNSQDKTAEMVEKEFPEVILIKNKKNTFFTKAHNNALAKAKGKYFLILNSDTYFVNGSLLNALNYLEKNTDIGACELRETYEDGVIVSTGSKFSTPLLDFYELSIVGKRFKDQKRVDAYRMKSYDRKNIFSIEVACDAALVVRKEILKKINGYDEDFLLYYTENDLSFRIHKSGYDIIHYGKAKIIHKVSASVAHLGWKKLDIYYHDLWCYYKKHGYMLSGFLLYALLTVEKYVLKIFRPHMFAVQK